MRTSRISPSSPRASSIPRASASSVPGTRSSTVRSDVTAGRVGTAGAGGGRAGAGAGGRGDSSGTGQSGSGGGSGAAGGNVVLVARLVSGSGAIEAKGGNGGNGGDA